MLYCLCDFIRSLFALCLCDWSISSVWCRISIVYITKIRHSNDQHAHKYTFFEFRTSAKSIYWRLCRNYSKFHSGWRVCAYVPLRKGQNERTREKHTKTWHKECIHVVYSTVQPRQAQAFMCLDGIFDADNIIKTTTAATTQKNISDDDEYICESIQISYYIDPCTRSHTHAYINIRLGEKRSRKSILLA